MELFPLQNTPGRWEHVDVSPAEPVAYELIVKLPGLKARASLMPKRNPAPNIAPLGKGAGLVRRVNQ
jgi:hypothetical protein